MEKTTKQPNIKDGNKDRKFRAQLRIIHELLCRKSLTMKEVEYFTGIDRANICRHISELRESGRVQVIRVRQCSITKHPKVGEYSANPGLFKQSNQIKLFGDGNR